MPPSAKVLVIVPHPDDAEFFAGGLLAKFAKENARIKIITATDGRCGTYQHSPEEIIPLRAHEATAAAKIIAADVELLRYPDYELIAVPPLELREKLVEGIRQFQPSIVIYQDPYGRDEVHPDHRTLAWAASDAIHFAQLPNVFPAHLDQGLGPHFVKEKYAYSEDAARWNKVVDITEYFDTKMEMMQHHTTQVEFLVDDVLKQAVSAGMDMNMLSAMNPSDRFTALRAAMETTAREIGKSAGFEFGEGYHYARFHPYVEALLASGIG